MKPSNSGRLLPLLALAALALSAEAAEVKILSAGAVEPGLRAVAAAYQRDTGHTAAITFNTAPEIRKRIDTGETWDVVIAPPAAVDELAKPGRLNGPRADLGRVGLGVAVRAGAPVPDISTSAALKHSILDADSLVFNRASTGIYLEGLLKRMGIADEVAAKSTRYPDGAAVMEHLLKGSGKDIGFGAMTEILLFKDKGLRLVGPLPSDVQNYTAYTAVASGTGEAQGFVRYLQTANASALISAAGIEP
jgi:molybdate transport system substrate-binding protein